MHDGRRDSKEALKIQFGWRRPVNLRISQTFCVDQSTLSSHHTFGIEYLSVDIDLAVEALRRP